MELAWKLHQNKFSPHDQLGFAIVTEVRKLIKTQLPHFEREVSFFDDRYQMEGYAFEGCVVVRLRSSFDYFMPSFAAFKEEEIEYLRQFTEPFSPRGYSEWSKLLDDNWYSFDTFTYVGPFKDYSVSWLDIRAQLIQWLNDIVLPEVESRNRKRVLEAIPTAPQYDIEKIIKNIYVLESDFSQGTCFHLRDIGLVTCEHVLRGELRIFGANQITKQYKVKKSMCDSTLDIAVIEVPDLELQDGLEIGISDNLNQMDHVAVAGFPNYRLGDSGIFSPGLVIGFRTISAIRRILVNAHIVQGNSGGPVVNAQGQVIGIAVTGADRQEDVDKTEYHSVVPIEALKYLHFNKEEK